MKSTHNKVVLRKTIVEEKVVDTIKTIRTHSNSPRTFLKAAAVIIPLVTLSYLTISHQDNINTIYTQMAGLNPFKNNAIIEPIVKIIPEIKIEVKEVPIVEVIEEESMPIIIYQKTYYIIAGAFAEQKNANNMLAKLNKWDYNATIVEGGNLLRVSYDTFDNRGKAILALNKIKQENPEAWLLTK